MKHKIVIINKDHSLISKIKNDSTQIDLEMVFFDDLQAVMDCNPVLHGHIFIVDLELLSGNDFDLLINLSISNGIIITTSKSDLELKLMLLEYGIDYLLTIPFDIRELWAYIKNIRKRLHDLSNKSGWALVYCRRILKKPDNSILKLTPIQLTIFLELLKKHSEVVCRKKLEERLGYKFISTSNFRLNTNISRLRSKLSVFDTTLAITCWKNEGYMFTGPKIDIVFENHLNGKNMQNFENIAAQK